MSEECKEIGKAVLIQVTQILVYAVVLAIGSAICKKAD